MSEHCAYCERAIEGQAYGIQRDGPNTGPVVSLCERCTGAEEPSLALIWAKISQAPSIFVWGDAQGLHVRAPITGRDHMHLAFPLREGLSGDELNSFMLEHGQTIADIAVDKLATADTAARVFARVMELLDARGWLAVLH